MIVCKNEQKKFFFFYYMFEGEGRVRFEDDLKDQPACQQMKAFRQRQVAIRAHWKKEDEEIAVLNCCSGFLLSNELIITCAHNLFSTQLKSLATKLQIFIKHNKINYSSDSIEIQLKLDQNVKIELNRHQSNFSLDLAVIKLKKQGMSEVNFTPILIGYQSNYQAGPKAYVTGFPDFLSINSAKQKIGQSSSKAFQSELTDATGNLSNIREPYIYYSHINTVAGHSGGPVMTVIQGKLCILGVHCEFSESSKTGRGIYLNSGNWKKVLEWAQQMKAPIPQNSYIYFNDLQSTANVSEADQSLPPQVLQPMRKSRWLESKYNFRQQFDTIMAGLSSLKASIKVLQDDIKIGLQNAEAVAAKMVQLVKDQVYFTIQQTYEKLSIETNKLLNYVRKFFQTKFSLHERQKSPMNFCSKSLSLESKLPVIASCSSFSEVNMSPCNKRQKVAPDKQPLDVYKSSKRKKKLNQIINGKLFRPK